MYEDGIKIAFGEDGTAHMLNDEYCIYCADEKTVNKVKEAVDKQKPLKVNGNTISKVKAVDIEAGQVYTYSVVRCPVCNAPMTLHKEKKYCEKCGQALDWSDCNWQNVKNL